MIIHRLIYAFSLVASIIFYVLYPPWISWYIFILLLLLLPFDLIISLPGMLTKGLLLSSPFVLEKDSDAVLTLTTTHSKSFPVRCIIVKVYVTGDGFSTVCKLKCPAESDSRREVTIDTTRSGVTIFEVKRFWTVSMIGLFSLPVNTKIKAKVLILPQPVQPANTLSLKQGTHLRPKPGGGFSEEHDIRMYQQGDPVRSIHWKISAKFDSIVIREPLVPPPHSRLIQIMKWDGALERDLILGRLRWVCDYMLKWQMPFYVRLDDDIVIAEVKQEEDLIDFLSFVLDASANKTAYIMNAINTRPPRFSWVFRVDAGSETRPAADEKEVAE